MVVCETCKPGRWDGCETAKHVTSDLTAHKLAIKFCLSDLEEASLTNRMFPAEGRKTVSVNTSNKTDFTVKVLTC